MKAHPALFEGEGRGEPKNEALLFQSTVDIHFRNAHKTLFQSTVDIHFQNAHKNCEGSRSVCLFTNSGMACFVIKPEGVKIKFVAPPSNLLKLLFVHFSVDWTPQIVMED